MNAIQVKTLAIRIKAENENLFSYQMGKKVQSYLRDTYVATIPSAISTNLEDSLNKLRQVMRTNPVLDELCEHLEFSISFEHIVDGYSVIPLTQKRPDDWFPLAPDADFISANLEAFSLSNTYPLNIDLDQQEILEETGQYINYGDSVNSAKPEKSPFFNVSLEDINYEGDGEPTVDLHETTKTIISTLFYKRRCKNTGNLCYVVAQRKTDFKFRTYINSLGEVPAFLLAARVYLNLYGKLELKEGAKELMPCTLNELIIGINSTPENIYFI